MIVRARAPVLACMICLVPLIAVGLVQPSFRLVSIAAALLAIMAVPFVQSGRFDWFSPWSWVFYSVVLGVFARLIVITFDIPDGSVVDLVFLRGQPKAFLLWPTLVVCLGMVSMTAGYLMAPSRARERSSRIFRSDRWNEPWFWITISVLLSLAWIGFLLFVRYTVGDLESVSLSGHRGVATDLSEYRSRSYLRWMVYLSDVACYLLTAKIISSRRIRPMELVAFLLSLGTCVAFYFFTSSRGGVVFLVAQLLAINYYLRRGTFPLIKAVVGSIVALYLLQMITFLRVGSGFNAPEQARFALLRALAPVVLNVNFIDVSKTAHIMAAVPSVLPFQWGKTLLTVFIAWIPRELWPGKPVIYVDNTIGQVVFGGIYFGAGGVPPGLVAEMYLNFWLPGVVAGCFVVGYLLKRAYAVFQRYSGNRNIVLLYVTCFMLLGLSFAGSGVTSVVVGFLTSFLPLTFVLHLITNAPITSRSTALEPSATVSGT